MEKDSRTLQPCPPQTQVKSLAFLRGECPGTMLREAANGAESGVGQRLQAPAGEAQGEGGGPPDVLLPPCNRWDEVRVCVY